MHDVGKLVVATILLEAERQITEIRNAAWIDHAEWLVVIKRTHQKVGMELAEKWHLPETTARCVRSCTEYDSADRTSPVNPVCLANALIKQVGVCLDAPDLDEAKALVMIGRSLMGVTDDVLGALMGNIKERVSGLYEGKAN